MSKKLSKVRLYCAIDLSITTHLELTKSQSNYLFEVMRLKVGDKIFIIDGKSGEYAALISEKGRKNGKLTILEKIKTLIMPPDLWLLFSPLKKGRTDFVIEKATELGVRKIIPVAMARTNSNQFRSNRMNSRIIKAVEQCGATFVPKIENICSLSELLKTWDDRRQLIFCDEKLKTSSVFDRLKQKKAKSAAILVGPEGGFSEKEAFEIRKLPSTLSVSLGPRALRAETAAIAALSAWQSVCGDWKH